MTRRPAVVLDELAATVAQLGTLTQRRDALMVEARAAGCTSGKIAQAAGVSPERVSQVAPLAARTDDQGAVPAAGDEPDGASSDTAPARGELAAVSASRRRVASYAPRVTAFVSLRRGTGITTRGTRFVLVDGSAQALLDALPRDVTRVFVTGDRPGLPARRGQTDADAVRSWGLAHVGGGWRVAFAGHYLADVSAPIYRWTHAAERAPQWEGLQERTVEVHAASAWFGGTDCTPDQAIDAWARMGTLIMRRFSGGVLLSTPATTGRDLWQRTIPAGKGWDVMPTDVRELVAATSGQGRAELLTREGGELGGFTYLDGRLMYGALTWGMPVGVPAWVRGADATPGQLAARSRWQVTATVPADWDHVGLLPHREAGGTGWRWPAAPGDTFTTWADGAEVALAQVRGWHVELHEGLVWREGKPLNTWRDKLVDAWQAAGDDDTAPDVAQLARAGIRSVLLFALGAFATRAHQVTEHVVSAEQVPAGATHVQPAPGGGFLYQRLQQQTAWAESMAHPEWSAAVWARARVRLLDAPGVGGQRVGALHVPRSDVLAFRTDALYLAADPCWADDGAVGRFRVKGRLRGPLAAPTSASELFALRDQAEAAYAARGQ